MFLLLPLMLAFYCFSYKKSKVFPLVCLGFMSAVIVCAIRMIFFYPHRIVPYSFAGNLIYFLLKECFLPSVLLYGLFLLVSKDKWEYKVNAVFPLEISFYIVYLPYAVINSSSGYNEPFSLLLKPVLYVAMFGAIWVLARNILKEKYNGKIGLIVLYSAVVLIYLAGPAVIESLYLMNSRFLVALLLSICYCVFPCFYFVLKIIKKIGQDSNNEYEYSRSFSSPVSSIGSVRGRTSETLSSTKTSPKTSTNSFSNRTSENLTSTRSSVNSFSSRTSTTSFTNRTSGSVPPTRNATDSFGTRTTERPKTSTTTNRYSSSFSNSFSNSSFGTKTETEKKPEPKTEKKESSDKDSLLGKSFFDTYKFDDFDKLDK